MAATSKKLLRLRSPDENHNHDLKDLLEGAAMRTRTAAGPMTGLLTNDHGNFAAVDRVGDSS
jgi:hypothetical protein